MSKITKDDIGRLEFYIRDLKEYIETYDVKSNNKMDIRATVSVWQNTVSVAHSLIKELNDKINA